MRFNFSFIERRILGIQFISMQHSLDRGDCVYVYPYIVSHVCTYYLLLFTEQSYSASLISAKSSSMTSTIVSRACVFFRGPWFRWHPRRSPLHLLEFHRLPRRTASSQSERDQRAKFWDTCWLVKFLFLRSFDNLLFLDSRLFRRLWNCNFVLAPS